MTYNATVLADSPKHYVTFDQAGGTNTDSGSQAATITVTGSPTKASGGVSGNALTYNGTTDYVTISSNQYDFGASSTFTFECWFKSTATTGQPTFIRRDGGGAAYLMRLNAGKIEFYCNQSGIITTASYADGNWHHVVGVKNGTATTLYVDGTSVGTGTGNTVSQAAAAQPIYLGESTSAASEMFKGTLDEVAIYSTALTSTQVTTHHNAGANALATPPAATMSLTSPTPSFSVAGATSPAMTLNLAMAVPVVREHKIYNATASEDGFGNSTDSTSMSINAGGDPSLAQMNVQFADLPSAPSGTTNSAIFSISYTNTYVSGTTDTYNVYRITSPWTVSSSGSFTQPIYDSTSLGSFTVGSGGGYYRVDISDAANAWAGGASNYGVAVVLASGTSSQHFAGYGSGSPPKLDVSYAPLPPNVTITAPVATMSLSAPAPVVAVNVSNAVPAMALSLDTVTPAFSETSNVLALPSAAVLSLSFPGGTPALPDYLAQPSGISMGVDISTPDVFIAYPVNSTAPAMTLSLATAAPHVDLTTNVLKVAPVMGMSLNMVGIFDATHDRYLNRLVGTLDSDDIWYKLDEASGSVARDSSVDTANVGNWVQNGSYNGSVTALNDGPQLRKAVRFDGTSYLRVGPYARNNSDSMSGSIPPNDVSLQMAVTVEFSLRTSQTDGVVFIGTGARSADAAIASPSAAVGIGPLTNGNELRLEGGYLVFVNAAGQKAKVRNKFVSDGQWHHIIVSISTSDQFTPGNGFVSGDTPSYLMIDGDHALVRYGAGFLGDVNTYGGTWLPYLAMSRDNGTGRLAGDLSNFIVRLNKYTFEQDAQSLYYEWSDANVINPTPMTLALETEAPKVKGSVKKMLALYGLPFTREYSSPATNSPAHTMYNYLDVLSGMVIRNLAGFVNLPSRLGGNRYWAAPRTFMLNDYLVVPVSIFGNLNNDDTYAQSASGTLNTDVSTTPNGIYVNDETGHPRFINLQDDLSQNVVDEYDVVTVVNYPWERPDDPNTGPENYTVPFHDFGGMTDSQWEQARNDFRDSIMESVYDGANLWIGDYYAAQHLGFIQGYDIHDFGRFDVAGHNQRAQDIDFTRLDAINRANLIGSGTGDYYSYPQANFYRRIVNLVPGLTDIASNEYGDWVEGWNVDDFLPNGNFIAYDIIRRPDGLLLGDRVSMGPLWMGSKFFGETSGSVTSLSKPTSRVTVTSAHPDGIAGTVVAREQDSYYGPNGVVVQNPFKDNVTTIAAEQGTIVRGRPIGGRVFIELMCSEVGLGYIAEDSDKTYWHGDKDRSGHQASTWSYDSRRSKELKANLTTSSFKFDPQVGSFELVQNTQYYFQYQDIAATWNLHAPMTYRGLMWLHQAPQLEQGDARVFANAMTISIATPNPTLDKTSSPASQVIGAMRLDLQLRQPANYLDGSVTERAFPMEMSLEMRGLGRTVFAPPMSLTVTTPNPTLKVAADTVTVYLDEGRNITLFLKEDN
jgi:hypothetical protein